MNVSPCFILPLIVASAALWAIAEPPTEGRLRQFTERPRRGDQCGTNEPAIERPRSPRGTNDVDRGREKTCHPMLKSVEEFRARNPQEFNRLMQLRNDDPEAFKREVRARFSANMKEKHPEAFTAHETERKNHEQVRTLRQQYHAATNDAQKAIIESQMRVLLAEIFDAKQQARQKELEELQNRLKDLQQSVESRATGKQQTLDEQVKDLTQGKPAENQSK